MVTILLSVLLHIPPSVNDVWQKILEMDIKHPKVVLAQAIIESARFTSPLAKTCNNLFGMRMPKKRKTLGKKDCSYKRNYAMFASWQQSVEDYKLYQDYILRKNTKSMTDDEYLVFISRTYAANPEYVQLIKKTMLKLKKYEN
jgi:flagellum-specific peptidoglycan hydrolase FlgJ